MSAILFKHQAWKPADVEALCGLSPVALRDLRRRGLAPESDGRTLPLNSVAQLLLQTELAKHGLGPKSVQAFVGEHAVAVVAFALDRVSSWTDESAFESWKKSASHRDWARFALLSNAIRENQARNTLAEIEAGTGSAVTTVVDLRALADRLAIMIESRPSSVVPMGKAAKK